MEELEFLKKDWNKESDDFKNYSEKDIYGMIKRKSVSITRILFVIGLTEIMLWGLYGYIDGELPVIRVAVFAVFLILTIYLYYKMKAEQSLISLMKSILNLRKIILGYAGISLLLVIADNVFHFDHNTRDFMAGVQDGREGNHYGTTNSDQVIPEWGNYVVFGIILILGMYLLFLTYKNTYGRILSDLKKNYQELSKVEENLI